MTRILKRDAGRFLADVPEEYVFWCHDGQPLRNMMELEKALRSMEEETFAYHANERRNDFSTWARDVLKDENLATALGTLLNRTGAARKVAERIAFLTSTLVKKPRTQRGPGRRRPAEK